MSDGTGLEGIVYRWRWWIAGLVLIGIGFRLGYLPSNPEEFRALLETLGELVGRKR